MKETRESNNGNSAHQSLRPVLRNIILYYTHIVVVTAVLFIEQKKKMGNDEIYFSACSNFIPPLISI